MRITSKGQVTIPQAIREAFGLLPHTEVTFRVEGGNVILEKAEGSERGTAIVAHMRGRATTKFTTDELMKLTRGDDS